MLVLLRALIKSLVHISLAIRVRLVIFRILLTSPFLTMRMLRLVLSLKLRNILMNSLRNILVTLFRFLRMALLYLLIPVCLVFLVLNLINAVLENNTMNLSDFFRKTFEFFKIHWKAFAIAFVFIALVMILASCQGLVNFNGSDGNNLLVDSNNTTGSVSVYGK